MKEFNVNKWIKRSHENAVLKGFHEVKSSDLRKVLMIVGEMMEGFEHYRCKQRANIEGYKQLIKDNYEMAAAFEFTCKDTLEEEIVDVAHRLLDLMGSLFLQMDDIKINQVGIMPDDPELWFDIQVYNVIMNLLTVFNGTRTSSKFKGELIARNLLLVSFRDVFLILLKLSRYFGFDFEEMLEIKYQYNLTRPKLHNKQF